MNIIYTINKNIKYDCLIKEPKIVEVTSFNEDGYSKFRKDFEIAHNTGQNIIPVIIDSYGGQAYSLLGMIGIIQQSKIPVATILQSKAMSCGAILFSCGKEGMRYIAPLATILLHDVSSYSTGKIEEIKSDAKESDRLNSLVYKTLDENCRQKKNYFKALVHQKGHADWYMDAKESIKHNLANHIGIPNLKVKVGIEFELENK